MIYHSFRSERLLLANACRVLAHRGLVDDILGHVSMRVSDDSVLIRCRGTEERGLQFTTPQDIHEVGIDGTADLPAGYSAPNELPLHLAAFRHDPEVGAVVHAHPPAVVAFSLIGHELRPIIGAFNIPAMRMARAGIPIHPSSALIRTTDLGDSMVASMGDRPACILRGHGLTSTGSTVQEAVIRALNIDVLAKIQLSVTQAGIIPQNIDDDDLANLPDLGSAFNDGHVWRFHLAALDHAGLLAK